MKKLDEEDIIGKIIKERIEENKRLFDEKELEKINSNINVIKKIYLLGAINAKEIYGNNLH